MVDDATVEHFVDLVEVQCVVWDFACGAMRGEPPATRVAPRCWRAAGLVVEQLIELNRDVPGLVVERRIDVNMQLTVLRCVAELGRAARHPSQPAVGPPATFQYIKMH